MQRQANGLLKCGNCAFTARNPSTLHYHRQFMGHPEARYFSALPEESKERRASDVENTDTEVQFDPDHPSEKDYKCRRCDYRSDNRDNVLRHVKCHTGERPHACTKCEKRFSRADRLKEHMECHANRRRLQCEHCDYKANHPSTMRNHRKRHLDSRATDERPYDGRSSSNGPRTPSSLSAVTESIEETDGWFEMESIEIDDDCIGPEQARSAEAEVLEVKEEASASSSKVASDGRFSENAPLCREVHTIAANLRNQCKICLRAYSTREHLRSHMLVHPGHTRVSCTVCGKSYRDNGTLKRHLIVHGERPFACSECDFTTTRRHSLTLHQCRHIGELFRCAHCDYAHPTKADVDRHSKIQHANKH